MKNLVLGIGIIVVFALVLWQGIEAFYPSPNYEDYCGKVVEPITMPAVKEVNYYQNQTFCLENNGTWRNGYCDFYYICQQKFDLDSDAHSKVVFMISIIVAIIVFIVGYSILTIEPVGSALMGSGIWAIFYGSVVNWRNLSNIWRFLLLLVALVLLIFIAVRLNKKK